MTQAKIDRRERDVGTSVGPYSEEYLQETIQLWQPHFPDRKLTREDAREIISNMTGFFRTLIEWGRKGRS